MLQTMEQDDLFTTVGPKAKLVDQVVARLQTLIIDGQLEPGVRLPPEREFAGRIGVSRTVLREAVRILVAILAPESSAGDHLRALARVAKLLRDCEEATRG